jgi:hypothetical protein
MTNTGFFRTLRITLLLVVLFFVGMNTWLTKLRSTDWNETLWMAVYPVNGDGSKVTQRYIESLKAEHFDSIETFLSREASRYQVNIREPITVRLAPAVSSLPPMPPENGSTLEVMLWSLKLRYWAALNDDFPGPEPDIRMYVVYHDPDQHKRLRHSLGLQKGMIGVVNAFAAKSVTERNNVVIAHEFLHTLGATDKYDPSSNQPIYPHGYAEPDREPLYPQRRAEIMGGRIPLSDHQAVMPKSVAASNIGSQTALEINWVN